ncbi:MAG: spondin domain-containing protein [Flammeovirgaceae bacterium]
MIRVFFLLLAVVLFPACEDAVPDTSASFQITISNKSAGALATNLSSGVYLLKKAGFPLFINDAPDLGKGLPNIAGNGIVEPLLSNLTADVQVLQAGSFNSIVPGHSVTIEVDASYGTFFNFATMFVDSNDLFYSFDEDGIHLFEPNGDPVTGNFTSKVWLWDVGTEQNQAPYVGSFQPPRQSFIGEGEAENGTVSLVNDEFTYPAKATIIEVSIRSTRN